MPPFEPNLQLPALPFHLLFVSHPADLLCVGDILNPEVEKNLDCQTTIVYD